MKEKAWLDRQSATGVSYATRSLDSQDTTSSLSYVNQGQVDVENGQIVSLAYA